MTSSVSRPSLTLRERVQAYMQLTRLDRPIGSELLLWPTLWAVWLAAWMHHQRPDIHVIVIFVLGVVLMRSAGCAINDFADRKVDGQVARTKNRPLASGRISAKEALVVFAVLVLFSASLMLFLPLPVFFWSFGALFLATLYPFTKRWTYLPQFVLGAAFSWGIPMAFVATGQTPGLDCWLLYLANLVWTVAYDTQYAMTDREDDLKVGIKSTAILFGRYDLLIIGFLQVIFVGLMVGLFVHMYVPVIALVGLVMAVVLFILQYLSTRDRLPAHTFKAFLDNRWVGRVVWLWLALACYLSLK